MELNAITFLPDTADLTPVKKIPIPTAKGTLIKVHGSKDLFFEFKCLENITNAFLRVQKIREVDINFILETSAVFRCGSDLLCSEIKDYSRIFDYDSRKIKEFITGQPTPNQFLGAHLLGKVRTFAKFLNKSKPLAQHSLRNVRDWECAYYLTIKAIFNSISTWNQALDKDPDKPLFYKRNDKTCFFTIFAPRKNCIYIHLGEWIFPKEKCREKLIKGAIEATEGRKIVRLKKNKKFVNVEPRWDMEVRIQTAIKKAAKREEDMEGVSVPLDITPNTIYLPFYTSDLWEKIFSKSSEPLSPLQRLKYMVQITKGLAKINELGFSHHDLKLENVMITDENQAVILDFAYGELLSEPSKELRGTQGYVPPEIYAQTKVSGEKIDAWTLGITLDILLNEQGSEIYYAQNLQDQNKALRQFHAVPMPEKESLKWVIRSLLLKDVDDRMTARAASPYLQQILSKEDISDFPKKS